MKRFRYFYRKLKHGIAFIYDVSHHHCIRGNDDLEGYISYEDYQRKISAVSCKDTRVEIQNSSKQHLKGSNDPVYRKKKKH